MSHRSPQAPETIRTQTLLRRHARGGFPHRQGGHHRIEAVTDKDTVYVGQLHSATGTMAISETGSIEGRTDSPSIRSTPPAACSDARSKSSRRTAPAIGPPSPRRPKSCWRGSRRRRLRLLDLRLAQGGAAVFEKDNGLLYYPTFYEGLEQSKNVIYTGQEATQQIIAGLDWIAKTKNAKTFFLVGSDYIWPRTSNKIARKYIENVLHGTVVGEEYYPAGRHAIRFSDQQDQAQEAGCHLLHRRRRQQRRVVEAAQGRRHHRRQADDPDHLGHGG
jgi:urea transport system substrate-binding protein